MLKRPPTSIEFTQPEIEEIRAAVYAGDRSESSSSNQLTPKNGLSKPSSTRTPLSDKSPAIRMSSSSVSLAAGVISTPTAGATSMLSPLARAAASFGNSSTSPGSPSTPLHRLQPGRRA